MIWYRGLSFLAQGRFADAYSAFDTCYSEVPGELAPRLAMALAAELDKDIDHAASLFQAVSRVDHSYATAVFGLARCFGKKGQRKEAVAALELVPAASSLYGDARKSMARLLISTVPQKPGPDELGQAALTIEALVLSGVEKLVFVRDLLTATLEHVVGSKSAVNLLGDNIDERSARLKLEAAYRDLARLSHDEAERIELVDLANQVRPRSFT